MITAGLDIGSRTTKLVVLEDGQPCEWILRPTGADPLGAARALVDARRFDRLSATGYGRHLARGTPECNSGGSGAAPECNSGANIERVLSPELYSGTNNKEGLPTPQNELSPELYSGDGRPLADLVLTEIKACALGTHFLFPDCRSVIDIGGQDTKVIALDADGGIGNFTMNDRCAAGTGRFLEFMAQTLSLGIEEFGRVALEGESSVRLNSMCVVFAESEVISLIARGVGAGEIARAVHEAMADRISSLARTIHLEDGEIMLAGGVARNPCISPLLEARLGRRLIVHERSQFIPALGAAIHAQGV